MHLKSQPIVIQQKIYRPQQQTNKTIKTKQKEIPKTHYNQQQQQQSLQKFVEPYYPHFLTRYKGISLVDVKELSS
jgi:hypothetical protein